MSTASDPYQIKKKLLKASAAWVNTRIQSIQTAISDAQESANDETKSSAGDKYETGRAMMQIDIENHMNQLTEAKKLLSTIDQIPLDKSEQATIGSLIITDRGNFFIAISVGSLQVDGTAYFVVSPQSPVALKLAGLKKGDSFINAGKTFVILDVA